MDNKFNISVLEYLGKFETGVMTLVSIIYEGTYYEGTYFYTSEDLVLTVPEELEVILGHVITEDENYPMIIRDIIKKVVPFTEIYNRMDDIDFTKWLNAIIESENKIDEDEKPS
jgi:hypothetical protein